jgi:O-antigen ligase
MKSVANARTDSSGSFRLDTWRQTLAMAGESPWLGQGMGSFHDAFPRYKQGYGFERVEHAENEYLEMLAEGGLVGLGLSLLGVLLLVGAAWRGLRAAEADPVLRGLGVGALAGLAALSVHSAVDFNLRVPSNALVAAFLVALTAAASGTRPLRAPALVAVFPLGVLVGLWLAPEPGRDVTSRAIAGAASASSPEAGLLRLTQADETLTASLSRRPADAKAWLLLAWTRAAGADGGTAVALARYAVSLDPERDGLRKAADSLIRAVGGDED